MTEFLSRTLAAVLRGAAHLLPAERQQWAEAVRAEAASVPRGRPQLEWLAGGLWLIAREAAVLRRIVYGLGLVAVGVVVSWTLWLSLRTAPAADVEATTDRMRVLAGIGALVVLPWVGRRRGVFGPVGDSLAARLVRVSGLAAMCGAAIWLVNLDRHSDLDNVIGSGHFNWMQEVGGLTLICAGLAAPRIARARWPQADMTVVRMATVVIAVVALLLAPFQTVAVGYIAAVLAATARRSPVTPAALSAGALAGLAAGSAIYGIFAIPVGESFDVLLMLVVAPAVAAILTIPAAAVAARRLPEMADPQRFRAAQIRQGLLTGLTAGAAAALFLMVADGGAGLLMMIIGPLAGLAGGVVGAALAADHRPDPRSGSFQAGLYTASS